MERISSQEWNARYEFSRLKAMEDYGQPHTTRATIEAKRQEMVQTSRMMPSRSDTPEFAGYIVGLVAAFELKMLCPGSGRTWMSGTGLPVCPSCHRGPGGLKVKAPRMVQGRWTGIVPGHERRQS